jgi:uncharacterized coiled-coil protein SlyX
VPEAAELTRWRRTAQVQARQIAELQETLAEQEAHLEKIKSGRALRLLHGIATLLGRGR